MCLVSAGLGDRHVELLSKILTMYSSTLQSICLAENYLTEKGVKALSSSLALCSQVSALDLSNNLIGDESTEQLCTVLRAMPRLTILNLSRNRLTEVSAAVLHKRVLNYRSRLQHLDLSYNQLGDELGSVLCELLQTIPPCLVQANFSYCGLTDKSCGAIAKCVAGCSTLRHLTLEGTFLEPGTMRHLMVSTMKHFELHRNEQNESLVVRYGGTLHDLQSTVGLSYKALKPALAELSDVALVKDLHVIRPFSSVKPGMLVCFRLRMVSFIERIEEVLIYLSQELRCSTDQLPIISYTANINDNPDQESCDRLCFLMFGVISDAYELTARLLKMIKESHVLLRMLGVRSAYLEYHAAASSGHSSVISENIAIQKSGFGGSGATDTLVPPLGDLNVYTSMPVATTVGFKHERWLDAEDGELPREAGAERFVFSRYDSEAQLADDPTVSNMQEVNSSFFVQDRNNREKLILAVRTLHKSKDISSSVAKFWEGVLGNRKFRAFAEVELVKAMRLNWIELVDMVPTLVVSEKVAHLNGDEVQLLKSLLSSSVVNLHVFPAVCERQLLYDAMFSRDLFRVQTILKLLDGHTGGHAAVWGQKLANEISILQKTWLNLKTSVRKFADLRLVEEYLLNCGRVGYTGPEMFEAVDLRQNVVSHAVERGDKKAVEELPRVKFRALMTNLLISRDVNALRVKLQAVQDSYHDFNEFSALPEYQVASSLVEQYERNQVRLSSAIQSRGIEELDAAIATAAYSYFYHADIEKTLRVMNDVSRNPALLMRRIVNGLRNSVMSEVEAGFEDLNKMGISHHALDTIICSKIYAIKSRNNQVCTY
ncbi:hypothetical protein EON64_01645 [archaeon]|nr:MAG: hypothetical protein EON64_01645 [archaeon]